MLLADTMDLTRWADRRDAQAILPRLVRQLVLATGEQLTRLSFRSDEGVQLPGWDGVVVAEEASAFVPTGITVWELGVSRDVRRKADDDYRKRTEDPAGINPAQATFIFVTPRRWPRKEDWREERQREGVWHDVRAYDVDDLAAWLEQAPVVHLWFSALIGKHPEGALDLNTFWDDWKASTHPATPPELLVAGREEVVDRIRNWIRTAPATLSLQAGSREEAISIFAAALDTLPEEERAAAFAHTAIVRNEHALNHLAAHEHPLTFVLDFDSSTAVAHAVRHGHRVLVPVGWETSAPDECLKVPKLQVDGAARALTATGLPEERARSLARLARRSLQAFRRKLALRPEVEQPAWANPDEGPALVPAMLAGAWKDNANGDTGAMARIAGGDYVALRRILVRWANESDPPARRVGDVWYVVSREDAWGQLARYLDRDDLERFEAVVLEVLTHPDPRFDLPEDERHMANVLGKIAPYSDLLCRGLAETLAIMATSPVTAPIAGDRSPSGVATAIVSLVLQRANADWRVWASLSEWGTLSLLAEAAPDVFLQAVDQALSGEEPILLRLFAADDGGLFTSSPHTGLLWALETVAWSPEHLGYVSLLLAKLAQLDPGGRLANRPQNSLRAIFLPWFPQTAASTEQRLRAIDVLRDKEPEIAWKLMVELLPKWHDVAHPTAKPQWQDWNPESDARITPAERWSMVCELVVKLVQDAGQRGVHWKDLIDAFPNLPSESRRLVSEGLENLEPGVLGDENCSAIWHALRQLLSHHRSFPEAKWALPNDVLAQLDSLMQRFEPDSVRSRFGWIFSHHPELPEGHQSDWQEHEQEVERRRIDAVRSIYDQGGIAAVISLAESVGRPDTVGSAFARTDAGKREEDAIFTTYLAADTPAHGEFARGFTWGRISIEGRDWAEGKLKVEGKHWSPEQQADFLTRLPSDARTWDIAKSLGLEADHYYWQKIHPFGIDEGDVERAARSFLEHGRPDAAVELLAHHDSAPPATVLDALEAFLNIPHPEQLSPMPVGYNIGKLLDRLEHTAEVERSRVAHLEWSFLPLLRYERQPRVLHEELARNPEFFVEAVTLVFCAEGEEPTEVSDEVRLRAQLAWDLLDSWRTIPGIRSDSSVDGDELATWVRQARELLRDRGREKIGDEMIGQMLSGSPTGHDGAWPHAAVRDLVEEIRSIDLERGIEIGRYNSRGTVTKSLYEGGVQEHSLAQEYEQDAQTIADRWPRVAAMLRRIAAVYRAEAEREDRKAELRQDLGG